MVKEYAVSTVNLARSGAGQMEGTEGMEEASLSRVSVLAKRTDADSCVSDLFFAMHDLSRNVLFFTPFSSPNNVTANKVIKSLAQVAPVYKGENGQSGASKNCYGRKGNTTFINVSLLAKVNTLPLNLLIYVVQLL